MKFASVSGRDERFAPATPPRRPPSLAQGARRADPTRAVYSTAGWREARAQALSRAGYRCERCGAAAVRGSRLEVDHIVELRRGGAEYDQENLQVLCSRCHSRKTRDVMAGHEEVQQ